MYSSLGMVSLLCPKLYIICLFSFFFASFLYHCLLRYQFLILISFYFLTYVPPLGGMTHFSSGWIAFLHTLKDIKTLGMILYFCSGSVQFSHSVMSDLLHPCPSSTPGACSNSCPSSQWCHPTISSSVVPFSTILQSFPASGAFPMSQWI